MEYGIKDGNLSVKSCINLWQALVRSNLEYGSAIWGKDKWLEGEQIQADMAKRILRCSSKTQREAIMLILVGALYKHAEILRSLFFGFILLR